MSQIGLFPESRSVAWNGNHNFYATGHRDFLVFNEEPLTDEAVTLQELRPIITDDFQAQRSATWSCNATFFFVVVTDGILLLNCWNNTGYLCPKKSYKFIEMYLEGKSK